MGINIIAHKITGERDEEGWLKTEMLGRDVFDSRGEKAFTREVEIEWEHIDEIPEGHNSYGSLYDSYQRPKDFDKAIQQAKEFGREDIAELFEKMRVDPELWIFISY